MPTGKAPLKEKDATVPRMEVALSVHFHSFHCYHYQPPHVYYKVLSYVV